MESNQAHIGTLCISEYRGEQVRPGKVDRKQAQENIGEQEERTGSASTESKKLTRVQPPGMVLTRGKHSRSRNAPISGSKELSTIELPGEEGGEGSRTLFVEQFVQDLE